MNKWIPHYRFVAIMLPVFIFLSCEKRIFNNRNKYIGEYNVTWITKNQNFMNPDTIYTHLSYDEAVVEYGKQWRYLVINLEDGNKADLKYRVYDDGRAFITDKNGELEYRGKFHKNSFEVLINSYYGLGDNSTTFLTGERKK